MWFQSALRACEPCRGNFATPAFTSTPWDENQDSLQEGLNVVGLVPIIGEGADGVNGVIYLVTGDYTNAALSGAAMVPFAGYAASGVKIVKKADNAYDLVKADKVDNVIESAGKIPVNPKKVDANYLKRNDIDPHTIKKDTLGRNAEISKYDTFVDKNGDIWLQKKGAKEFIPTYENIVR